MKNKWFEKDGSFVARVESELGLELYKSNTPKISRRKQHEINNRQMMLGIGRQPAIITPHFEVKIQEGKPPCQNK